MLGAIALLLSCQFVGEAINRASGLPVPGPVLGMFLLAGWLAVRPAERPALNAVAAWLIAHLSVMFMPAAVGIMEQGPLLSRYGLAIGLAIVVSVLLTLTVTALVFRAAIARAEGAR